MTEKEINERQRVVAVAKSWLKTPYHHFARKKGVGVDCGLLLAEVYEEAGICGHINIPYYPEDWYLHHSEEVYLNIVESYAREVKEPLPGDIALYTWGKCVSHGAIIERWPTVIHAFKEENYVTRDNALRHKKRFVAFYSPFQWEDH